MKENNFIQPFLFVRREGHYEQIAFDDIIYIKAKRGYIQIITARQTYLVMNTLAAIQKQLPPEQFCRIHNSYIVSLQNILAFDRSTVWLQAQKDATNYKTALANIRTLPIGSRFRNEPGKSVTMLLNKPGGSHKKGNVTVSLASSPR